MLPVNTRVSVSPGLAFLAAAVAAMPATLGNRVMSASLNDTMQIAIRCRFKFDRNDGVELSNGGYSVSTCVGVFYPLSEHFYHQACAAGGTYAAMWERHSGFRPWMSLKAFTRDGELPGTNRVAPGIGVRLPMLKDESPELETACWPGGEVFQTWHCTSITNEKIVLCRYRAGDWNRNGRPAKIWKMDRAAWEVLQNTLKPAEVPEQAQAA